MLEFNQGGVLSLKKGMISSICSKSRRPNCSRSVLVVMSHDWPTTCKGGHDLSFMRDVENLGGKDMKFKHSLYSINSPPNDQRKAPEFTLHCFAFLSYNTLVPTPPLASPPPLATVGATSPAPLPTPSPLRRRCPQGRTQDLRLFSVQADNNHTWRNVWTMRVFGQSNSWIKKNNGNNTNKNDDMRIWKEE